MAHLIDNLEKVDLVTAHGTFCSLFGDTWHGGFVPRPELATPDELIESCPTIFAPTVEIPVRVASTGPDGEKIYVDTGYKSLMQKHHTKSGWMKPVCVGVQPASYTVLNFADALRAIVGKERIIDTAFIMKSGAQFGASLQIGESFVIGKTDDGMILVLTIHSGHDGTALWAFITAIRAVCANTINFGKAQATKVIKLRHTKGIHVATAGIMQELGLIQKEAAEFREFCNAMASKELNQRQMQYIFDEVFPKRGRPVEPTAPAMTGDDSTDFKLQLRFREEQELFRMAMEKYGDGRSEASERLDTLLETQPGADMSAGTLWSAVNAITYYLDHEHVPTIRGDKTPEAVFDARLASNINGYSQDKKDQALALAKKILTV
jgi:hypothetical protein